MNTQDTITQESIREFGSDWTQERYKKKATQGCWESEEILIKKYFTPSSNILDIGCGSGRTALPLSKAGFQVTGIDITPEMITTAKEAAQEQNVSVDFQVGDATALEFSENSFDGALFANCGWAQIPGKCKRLKALEELHRVLKPGAKLILVSHVRYYSLLTVWSWIARWIHFHLLGSVGMYRKPLDFGDIFFTRPYTIDGKKVQQFMHMGSKAEIEQQIHSVGFIIEEKKSLGEISKNDAKTGHGQLSKYFNSHTSPIFYVCRK